MQVVALMRDDKNRTYEVARDENGALYHRCRPAKKWNAIHMTLNPDLETYLARCAGNFGYTIETL